MSVTLTPDEASERIRSILNAADLEIGLAMTRDDCRVLITGGGDEARLGLRAACRVYDAICAARGATDPDARLLALMVDVADGSRGAAS